MTAKSILLRSVGMLIGGLSLLVLGGATVSLESRLWMAPTMLGVVLLMRMAYDLWELDGPLSAASVVALALLGMALAAFRNLADDVGAPAEQWPHLSSEESSSLAIRAWAFLVLGLVASAIACWRVVLVMRAERD